VALLKPIGCAFLQSADENRNTLLLGIGNDGRQGGAANPATLIVRMNVEIVQLCTFRRWAYREEADLCAFENDETRVLGTESASQPLTSASLIETSNALQTLAHRGNTNVG
jgi:hypothetical protein